MPINIIGKVIPLFIGLICLLVFISSLPAYLLDEIIPILFILFYMFAIGTIYIIGITLK